MEKRPEDWSDAWALFSEERESLASVQHSVCRAGVSKADAEDLLHAFVVERLPRIAARSRGLDPSTRGRYVRAAYRNFVRTWLRFEARERAALERVASEMRPVEDGANELAELEPDSVRRALTELGEARFAGAQFGKEPQHVERARLSARAAGLFLGLDDPPATIRQIAARLKTTRYAARQLVLDGLLGGALALGQTGALSTTEAEACRRILLDGVEVDTTARELGLSAHRVRIALKRARSIVATALQGD